MCTCRLHVYCEVVPSICEALRFERARVRRVLILGSSALLTIQLMWSNIGIALAPFVAGSLRADPVDSLLAGAAGRGLAVITYTCAASAVATTLLGTGRALSLFCQDAFVRRPPTSIPTAPDALPPASTSSKTTAGSTLACEARSGSKGLHGALAACAYVLCTAIAALIACTSSTADAFFGAIE